MELTDEEKVFLNRHRFGVEDVFDSRGMPQAKYKDMMRKQGRVIALGSPCEKAGHRLRTRAGHCVQCRPERISYQGRYRAKAYVYIAGSKARKLIKVGTASDVGQRHAQLNSNGYAGSSDWVILFSGKAAEAGKIEMQVHAALKVYASSEQYEKDGEQRNSRESFACSFTRAYEALERVVKKDCLEFTESRLHANTAEYRHFPDKKETAGSGRR